MDTDGRSDGWESIGIRLSSCQAPNCHNCYSVQFMFSLRLVHDIMMLIVQFVLSSVCVRFVLQFAFLN